MLYQCPHCDATILIEPEDINCGIFRHGVYKFYENTPQMDPHSSKEICDKAVAENLIYGCGKPFKIILKDNKFVIEVCDYI